jgi:membrane protease YdiL (CAAX protease family)
MGVTPSGWVFLLLIGVLFPLLAVRSAFRVRAAGRAPTAVQHLVSVVVSQGMMLFLALSAATYEGLELFPRPDFGWQAPVLALAFLVLSLGTLPARWRWKPLEERRRNLWVYPRGTSDLGRWAVISLLAGTVEEIVYRGVMLQLLVRVLGAWWPAMLLCVVAFALAHFVQGWRAMLVIVLLAAAAHGIVFTTENLYTAMFVHVVYDFLAGVLIVRLAKGDGLLDAPASSSALPS